MSRMRANKEEVDARGDDYAANENDYYDPSTSETGTCESGTEDRPQ